MAVDGGTAMALVKVSGNTNSPDGGIKRMHYLMELGGSLSLETQPHKLGKHLVRGTRELATKPSDLGA